MDNYIGANFKESYNPRIESELIEYKIRNGMKSLADSIRNGSECTQPTIEDMLSAYILKKSIEEVEAGGSEQAAETFNGKIKNMLVNMKSNGYVKALAKGVVKNPEGFAELITSGKLEEVYDDFKAKGGRIPESLEQRERREEQPERDPMGEMPEREPIKYNIPGFN